jgi:hypothetical protein
VLGGDEAVVLDADDDTVTITGTGADTPGSSLECTTEFEVEAGDTITFDYVMGDDTDPCGGGVPRVFVVVDGTVYNTFDDDPDCSDQSGTTITYTLPVGGTVTHIGLVYDRQDTGSVTYSNVEVGGTAVDF